MGRMQRVVLPGSSLHIIRRGNNRSATFFAEEDYQFYLESLEHALNTYDCALHEINKTPMLERVKKDVTD